MTDLRPVEVESPDVPEELPDTTVVATVEQAIHRGSHQR